MVALGRPRRGRLIVSATLASRSVIPPRGSGSCATATPSVHRLVSRGLTTTLGAMTTAVVDVVRDGLRVGVHSEVEVTGGPVSGLRVSQVFVSALPVAYTRIPASRWARFATLVLEGAYEATLLAGVLNAARTRSRVVSHARRRWRVRERDDVD